MLFKLNIEGNKIHSQGQRDAYFILHVSIVQLKMSKQQNPAALKDKMKILKKLDGWRTS